VYCWGLRALDLQSSVDWRLLYCWIHDSDGVGWENIEIMSDGIKYDEGKPKIGMVVKYFGPALMEVAKAGTFGCAKYGNGKFWDFNWNRVENGVERYTDALMRHLLKEDTEKTDPETGILHAALVAWNSLARLVLILAAEGSAGQSNTNHE